jgi:hypothetical protein
MTRWDDWRQHERTRWDDFEQREKNRWETTEESIALCFLRWGGELTRPNNRCPIRWISVLSGYGENVEGPLTSKLKLRGKLWRV